MLQNWLFKKIIEIRKSCKRIRNDREKYSQDKVNEMIQFASLFKATKQQTLRQQSTKMAPGTTPWNKWIGNSAPIHNEISYKFIEGIGTTEKMDRTAQKFKI